MFIIMSLEHEITGHAIFFQLFILRQTTTGQNLECHLLVPAAIRYILCHAIWCYVAFTQQILQVSAYKCWVWYKKFSQTSNPGSFVHKNTNPL